MKEKNIFLLLVAITFLLLSILFTNIGFAKETIITSNPTYLSNEFNVEFNQNSKYLNNNITIINPQTASFKNIDLSKVGEVYTFTIPVINNSPELSASLSTNIYNSNPEFFKVTCDFSKNILNPKSDEAFMEINIELIKQPINSNETTNITFDIVAEPIN